MLSARELTNNFARQTVIASVLTQNVLKLLRLLERMHSRYLVSRHCAGCAVLCGGVVFQLVFQKPKIELSQASTVESRVIRNVDWAEEGALDRLVIFARVSLGLGGFSFVIA